MSHGGGIKDVWFGVTILLIYYRFIVRFIIGLEFLFLFQFFLENMSSLSISSSDTCSSTFCNHIIFIDRYNIGIFESCYASSFCIESTAIWCWILSPVRREVVYTFLVAVC